MKLKHAFISLAVGMTVMLLVMVAQNANAELYEYSGAFPVPDNLDTSAERCFIEMTDATTLVYTCRYIFTAEDIETFIAELTDPEKEMISFPDCEFGYQFATGECLDEIVIVEPSPSNFVPEDKPMFVDEYEADLKAFSITPPVTPEELDYFQLLRTYTECKRGEGSALGITQEDSFITTETIIQDATDVEGKMGRLLLAYEECIGQLNFDVMFGPDRAEGEIIGKEGYFGVKQPYHAEFTKYDEEYWLSIPNQSTMSSDASERDLISEQSSAFDKMCASEFVTLNFKKDQGCTLIENFITTAPRSDGTIGLNSYIMDQLARYKAQGDQEQLNKILDDKQYRENLNNQAQRGQ